MTNPFYMDFANGYYGFIKPNDSHDYSSFRFGGFNNDVWRDALDNHILAISLPADTITDSMEDYGDWSVDVLKAQEFVQYTSPAVYIDRNNYDHPAVNLVITVDPGKGFTPLVKFFVKAGPIHEKG